MSFIKKLLEVSTLIIAVIFTFIFGPFHFKIPIEFVLFFFIFLPGYFRFIRGIPKGYLKGLFKKNYDPNWFERVLISFKEGVLLLASSTYLSLFISTWSTIILIISGILLNVNLLLVFQDFFNIITAISIFGSSIFLIYRDIEIKFPHMLYDIKHDKLKILLIIFMWLIFIYLTGFTFDLSQFYETVKKLLNNY